MTTKNGQHSKKNTCYKVMIVDDSSVVRNILKKFLSDASFIEIVGEAENGKVAIDKALVLQPNIILLDISMPEMDGITALPYILQASPLSQIIMVSSITEKNATISIKALSLGAVDYLQKPEAGIDKEIFKDELLRKIKALGFASKDKMLNTSLSLSKLTESRKESIALKPAIPEFKPLAIAIVSSTGGPQALQTLFSGLKNNIPNVPIFITQHMPPVFTKYLANSLSDDNLIKCHEAHDKMEVLPGNIYLAPGDFHMLVEADGTKVRIKLDKSPHENFCRPAADPMLKSLLKVYGKKLLVIVLTGMGQDGLIGAKAISEKGGMVIAQDKASSIVWGMPGAVCSAGIINGVYPISQIASRITEICAAKV